jgi:hypothetical protein
VRTFEVKGTVLNHGNLICEYDDQRSLLVANWTVGECTINFRPGEGMVRLITDLGVQKEAFDIFAHQARAIMITSVEQLGKKL